MHVLLLLLLMAADYSGTYHAELLTTSGKEKNTLVLKTSGSKLTGTLTNQMGTFPLQNGSVVKDEGDDLKMTYRGHVFGNEITFKIEAGERLIEMVAAKSGPE